MKGKAFILKLELLQIFVRTENILKLFFFNAGDQMHDLLLSKQKNLPQQKLELFPYFVSV